ncbi:Hsp70 family protein [Gulosibacter sediminis]|uniref:Hsp70 family protein n=1 Tax=Gulosibacter sediminis TaxID=1729695 RepID=UPI001867BE1F|nr:Hsp70 family protein [Gulosibacter sediminis]
MAWRLAIDFGTSNTAAAIHTNGNVRPVALSDVSISMPSAIVLTPNGYRVGDEAINAQLRHPDGFERTPKTLIGRSEVVLAGKIVDPEEIAREIYSYVRAASLRRQNNEPPAEVWLTHPVAWAPSQIETLRSAAVAAGFAPESIRTVNEPIAAAAHYARNHQAAPGSRVAVFDFGGGTLDIAVLERAPLEPQGYRVLAYGGDPVLGGRSFDARLLDWTLDTLSNRGSEELAKRLHQPKTMAELRAQTSLSRAVTAAKTELSTRPDADIAVSLGDEDAVVTITRQEYETLIAEDLDRAGKLLKEVFDTVSGPGAEVMYLTGGSSRTPAISEMIRERTGIRIATLDDPKLVVAEGALYVAPLGSTRPAQAPGSVPPTGHFPPAPSAAAGPTGPQGQRPNETAVQPSVPPQTSSIPRQQQGNQQQPTHQYNTQQFNSSQQQYGAPQQQPNSGAPNYGQNTSSTPTRSFGTLDSSQTGRGPGGGDRQDANSSAPPYGAYASSNSGGSGYGGGYTPSAQAAYGSGPDANSGGQPKKTRRGLLISVIAVIAVIVIGGGIWGGIALFGNQNAEPAEEALSPEVPSGEIECWDGSTVSGQENCAELTGTQGLEWVVKVDGASCTDADLGVKSTIDCTWYDRSNTHLYVMEFDSYDQALEYGQTSYDTDTDWKIGDEVAGTQFEGEYTDAGGGYSHYYVYEDQPYGVFITLGNDDSGNHDNLSDIQGRFTPKPLADVAYAVATTDRTSSSN